MRERRPYEEDHRMGVRKIYTLSHHIPRNVCADLGLHVDTIRFQYEDGGLN